MFRPRDRAALLATLICVAVAPTAQSQTEADRQKAVAEIEKSGGKVGRDEAVPDKPVVAVNFGVTQVADAGLEPLKAFPKLKSVILNNTKVTDAGLDQLKPLAGLEKLYLVDTAITDAGLERLKGLTKLRVLSLVGTKVTDAGLDHLKGMADLREVFLAATKVTDAGVKRLKEALPKATVVR